MSEACSLKIRLLFSLLLVALISAHPAISGEKDFENPLSYSVLVAPEKGYPGSGVFIRANTATYLVTARHVLLNEKENAFKADFALLSSPAADVKEIGHYAVRINLKQLYRSGNIKEDREHDLILVRIDHKRGDKFVNLRGVTVKHEVKSGPARVDSSIAKTMGDLVIGEKFYLPGYRTIRALRHPQQFNLNEPEMRTGTFLAKELKTGLLYSSYLSELGDSGAPVFTVQPELGNTKLRIVGIHTSTGFKCQLIKTMILEQCGRAAAMDYVLRLINEFPRLLGPTTLSSFDERKRTLAGTLK
jgi:hypothetical protein